MLPLAALREDLERSVVEIDMPERADVLRLVASHLSLLATFRRDRLAGTRLGPWPWHARQSVSLHVPPHRGIRRQWSQRGIGLEQSGQVVVVQLVAPVWVGTTLRDQSLGDGRVQRHLA